MAALPSAANAVGELTFESCMASGPGHGCRDLPGAPLDVATGVAVSPSGGGVYVGSWLTHAVSHLWADPMHGQLSWDGCISDDGSGGYCADLPGTGGLGDPPGLAVSPDGGSLYATGGFSNTVSHFFVNATGGQISWDGCVENSGFGGLCADIPGTGTPLFYPDAVAVSPNGRALYVTSHANHSISQFSLAPGGQIAFQA